MKQSKVWESLRAGACVALVALSSAVQAQAAAQTTPLPEQNQSSQAPATSPQGVNPTAPAPPQPVQNDTTGNPGLPQAPKPILTQPLFLRPTGIDYAKGNPFWPDPLRIYAPKDYPATRLGNAPRLNDLLRDGKIYLSLADAVTLALENNYDIAIARINLDIADTDLLRAEAGSVLRGVSTGLITNTLGGSSTTITGGGGPGGTNFTTAASTGANGLVLSTNGSGPAPEVFDPALTGTLQ